MKENVKKNAIQCQEIQKIKKSFNVFPWTKGPGIGDEVASEVVRFHERLVVEIGDNNVLDIATNIEHLKKDRN